MIDRLQDDYERARAEFTAVLTLFRELGDPHGEAHAREALEGLDEAADG